MKSVPSTEIESDYVSYVYLVFLGNHKSALSN